MTTRQANPLKSFKIMEKPCQVSGNSKGINRKGLNSPWWPVGNRIKCIKTKKNRNLEHTLESFKSTTRQASPLKSFKMIKNHGSYH